MSHQTPATRAFDHQIYYFHHSKARTRTRRILRGVEAVSTSWRKIALRLSEVTLMGRISRPNQILFENRIITHVYRELKTTKGDASI